MKRAVTSEKDFRRRKGKCENEYDVKPMNGIHFLEDRNIPKRPAQTREEKKQGLGIDEENGEGGQK